MKDGARFRRILRSVNNFIIFFLLVASVITPCLMLFLEILAETMQITFNGEKIALAAKLTMVNVIVISLIFATIDSIRRRLTVNRPVRRIIEATDKMIKGDFSVRIRHTAGFGTDEQFNEVIDCINKMAEELSGVETLRTDFIANVSHEIKTPLSVIHNYGTLLAAKELPEDKRTEYAKAITDASRRLSDMMENVLKLNRLENQTIFPKSERYDLGEQLCESLLQYEHIWETRNIGIETDIEDGITVSADKELLYLVWNNLFSNAFKFTADGGKVSLSIHSNGDHAVVRITDTGCGMSAEVGEHIFEKFYQGDTSRATRGNGLGLALVKRVIDIVGAEIGVESAVGKGTAFTVKIRRCRDDVEEAL